MLNIDGAALGNPGKGGTREIFKNSSGDWILGYIGSLPHTSNTHVELITLLQGLRIAEQMEPHTSRNSY